MNRSDRRVTKRNVPTAAAPVGHGAKSAPLPNLQSAQYDSNFEIAPLGDDDRRLGKFKAFWRGSCATDRPHLFPCYSNPC